MRLEIGSKVMLRDGKQGIVIQSNQERSLIDYKADPRTGADRERNWFDNQSLKPPK